MSYKIIIDSCGELLEEWKEDPRFESVALTLNVGGENIIDDATFDQASFLKKVAACPECPKSACPSPERYMKAYDCDAEHIYAVTLSAELSGSYNSAVLGRSLLLEDKPGRKIHVFNSRSASIGETLIGMKIQECEEAGCSFEEVIEKVNAYIEEQHTFFVLDNLETLRKNGRLSKVKALVANALKIKPVMKFGVGKLDVYQKCRGMKNARKAMIDAMKKEFETNFKEAYEAGKLYLMAASSSTAEVTEEWIRQIKESFPGMDVMCDNLSLGLSCHIGPDGLGIACCNKAE